MKIHEFTVYGGQTENAQGKQFWPDYIKLRLPRSVQLEIIKFLATSLQDDNMEEASINFIGQYVDHGEKDQEELFGPVDNAG